MIVLLGNSAFVYSTSTIIPLIAEDALNVGAREFGLLVSAVGLEFEPLSRRERSRSLLANPGQREGPG